MPTAKSRRRKPQCLWYEVRPWTPASWRPPGGQTSEIDHLVDDPKGLVASHIAAARAASVSLHLYKCVHSRLTKKGVLVETLPITIAGRIRPVPCRSRLPHAHFSSAGLLPTSPRAG
jgi:hypothetical protein